MGVEKKGKILVADDEEALRGVLKSDLERHGFEVFTASNGKECLELARLYKPDLAIIDVLMPGMDGISVASYLKLDADTRDISIVILTAYIGKDEESGLQKKLRNVKFMTKPFRLKELLGVIEAEVAKKKSWGGREQ